MLWAVLTFINSSPLTPSILGENITSEQIKKFEVTESEAKLTPITDEFMQENFIERNGEDVLPMFIIRKAGELT